jgi:hypothetical protein
MSCRSNTLAFYKKAISFFMPNNHYAYNVITREGNPTRSPAITELIKRVLLHEVQEIGVPSQARRDLSIEELREVIRIAEASQDFPLHLHLPTSINLDHTQDRSMTSYKKIV